MIRTRLRAAALLSALLAGAAHAQPAAPASFSPEKVRAAVDVLLPSGVEIAELKVDGSRTTISGISTDTVQLSQLLRKIESAAEFEAPNLEQVSNVDGMSAFTVVFEVKCPRDADGSSSLCPAAAKQQKAVFKCLIGSTPTFQGHPCPPGKDA